MSITRLADAPTVETPNAVMRTLASPARDRSALAVWHVALQPGASGPEHWIDADQVYVVLSGALDITIDGVAGTAEAGDALFVPRGALRRIRNAGGAPVAAVVSMPAGGRVSTPSGSHTGELPWAR